MVNENVEMAVLLKCLSNFWRTLEMQSINCEINFILTWSEDCVISSATGETKFKITDTKPYVPVATLSIQDNAKLILKEQLIGTNINQIFQHKYKINI